MAITATERYALDLLSAWHTGKPAPCNCEEVSCEEVREELCRQTVMALPVDVFLKAGLSKELENKCLLDVANALKTWFKVMQAQEEVLELLAGEGISVAVLKGAAAGMYYPEPERRCMGDIDLIVGPDDFSRALGVLTGHGWTDDTPEYSLNPRHACLFKRGFPEVELHRRFSSSGNKAQDDYLDERVFDGLGSARMVEVGGFKVPVLPPLENGLVLLSHVNQHLGSGLGLRQVIDWMLFVEAELDDGLWENGFGQAAKAIGMECLAKTLTLMCKRHLGLRRTAAWCDDADSALADDLLEYVMAKGNMGRKCGSDEQATLTVLHRFRDPVSAVKGMYASGCAHWGFAREKPLLAPAAVVYGGLHYLRKGLNRGVSLKQLREEARTSSEEVQLFERLGVTRL